MPCRILSFLGLLLVLVLPSQAAEIIGTPSKTLRLEVSKGVLMRLEKEAGTIFIANPGIADVQVKSPRLIYLTGKAAGETTLYILDDDEQVMLSRRVHVRHNLSKLSSTLKTLLPGSAITLDSIGGGLLMSGTVANATQAADAKRIASRIGGKGLISQISVSEPNQVQLRVKIAEVARSVLKRFGVNISSALSIPNGSLSLDNGNPFIQTPFTFLDPNIRKTFLTQRTDTNTALFNFNNGNIDANALLDALDREGLITILAEPNLTAVSGETAQFLAGGEFPIIVPGSGGRVSVTFKSFGVSLAFTPTVVNGNRINLKVRPEVSQLSSTGAVQISGFFIPALTTRRTETTVELGSGQSFAIAGILQNNITRNLEKFPGLADLPILGALFRSDRFERNETELVIIVTPYIVRPVSDNRLALPTDGLIAPTDVDRLVHNRLYRPNPIRGRRTPQTRGRGPVGAAGFVLD